MATPVSLRLTSAREDRENDPPQLLQLAIRPGHKPATCRWASAQPAAILGVKSWRTSPRHPDARRSGVRLVIADDNTEIRSALGLLLRESVGRCDDAPASVSCGIIEAADAAAVVRHLKEGPCDFVLLDWELPGLPPGELLAEIRRLSPDCRVIAMSGRPEARRYSSNLGVHGFVSKNEPPDRLLELLDMTGPTPSETA